MDHPPKSETEAINVTDPTPRLRTTLFGVQGMTCSACTNAIQDAVSALPSVQTIIISLLNSSMSVTYDENGLNADHIIELVEDLGYEATEWETKLAEEEGRSPSAEREVHIRFEGIHHKESPAILNEYLSGLGLQHFTPIHEELWLTTVRYVPSSSLNIRTILEKVPHPFSATVHQPPSIHSRSREIQMKEKQKITRLFLLSFIFAIPTFIIGVVGMMLLPKKNRFRQWCEGIGWWGGASRAVILLWVLATIVQFGIARIFFVRGWASLHFRRSWSMLVRFGNMNILVALSTGVAYVASVVMMVLDIRTDPMKAAMSTEMRSYFDSSVFLTFFILMGKALEARAKLKTGDAIAMLGQLRPERAVLLRNEQSPVDLKSQQSEDISVDLLEVGDHILVRPGSIPPADGVIVEGTTTVDESSLTGESIPVLKGPGDAILSGTTVLTSAIVMRIDYLGEETMLQQIVRAVGESQNKKAPIEELADRITAVFVPIIIYLAIIVSIIWLSLVLTPGTIPDSYLPHDRIQTADRVFFALEFAIAVLAVACPCGIGLAAPAAQAVGAGMTAKAGILAQGGGTAFQLATQVDIVVFDKTGTLTQGKPSVVKAQILKEETWILDAIRVIEHHSSHPLAAALVWYAQQEQSGKKQNTSGDIEVLHIEEVAGKGAQGQIRIQDQNVSFRLGNSAMIGDAVYPEGQEHHMQTIDSWKRQGYSVVSVAFSVGSDPSSPEEGQFAIAAIFAIVDPPRPEAKRVIASLRRSGKDVYMLSGDNETTAQTIGRELGINDDRVVAGVLPHEKAQFISELRDREITRSGAWPWTRGQKKKAVVMFTGDGLNDSAAVAAADVGVAFAHGSQVTLTSASFVLLQTQAPLESVLDVLGLSTKVYRRQKFNFAWAMIYNLILIPLAAGAFYPVNHTRIPPVWSALAMALSSVSVLLSSLALRWGI